MESLVTVLPTLGIKLTTAKQHFTPSDHSPLFRLPRELRNEIYDHLLATPTVNEIIFRFIELTFAYGTLVQLHLACKQLRQELIDAIHCRISHCLNDFAAKTSVYPFQKGQWAERLGSEGLCKKCRPETSVTVGAAEEKVAQILDGDINIIDKTVPAPLRARGHPCSCVAHTLPTYEALEAATERLALQTRHQPVPIICGCGGVGYDVPSSPPHNDRFSCFLAVFTRLPVEVRSLGHTPAQSSPSRKQIRMIREWMGVNSRPSVPILSTPTPQTITPQHHANLSYPAPIAQLKSLQRHQPSAKPTNVMVVLEHYTTNLPPRPHPAS